MLQAINIDGHFFDTGGIKALIDLPQCTPDRITRAYDKFKEIKSERMKRAAERGKTFNPIGVLFGLIKDGWTERVKPKPNVNRHSSPDEAEQQQIRKMRTELEALPQSELVSRVQRLHELDSSFWKDAWAQLLTSEIEVSRMIDRLVRAVHSKQPVKPSKVTTA